MNDAAWCRARLDELEDRVRGFAQTHGRFEAVLDDYRVVWHDAAGREVFAYHLDPCREEVAQTLKRLAEQLARLRDVVARMDAAGEPAADVRRFSDEAAWLRAEADREVRTAHHRADRSLDETSASRDSAEHARRVLASI
jgi:hypothetical protein